MFETHNYAPPRQLAGSLQFVLILCLLIAGVAILQRALDTPPSPTLMYYLLALILTASPIPWLAYRLYALTRSSYTLERESIHLRWGLRSEIIPMTDVLWVARASEVGHRLPPAWLGWPGTLMGSRQVAGLGTVEFMGTRARNLVLIATAHRTYGISPVDPNAFLHAFQSLTELGSLSPVTPSSIYPSFILQQVLQDRVARFLLVASALTCAGVITWVFLIPLDRSVVSLGFTPQGNPKTAMPAVHLTLLAVLSTSFFFVDLFLGLFFYRVPESRILSYVLWTASLLTALLFLAAIYFILQVS